MPTRSAQLTQAQVAQKSRGLKPERALKLAIAGNLDLNRAVAVGAQQRNPLSQAVEDLRVRKARSDSVAPARRSKSPARRR